MVTDPHLSKYHSPAELEEIEGIIRKNPRMARLRDAVVDYARERGGRTLEFWQHFQGPWFGEPWMMTLEGCAKQLGVAVSDVVAICAATEAAVGSRLEGPSQ